MSTITSSRPSATGKKFNLLSKNISKNINKILPRVPGTSSKVLPTPPAAPTAVTNEDLAGFFVNLPPETTIMEADTAPDGTLLPTGTIKPAANTPIGYGFEIVDGKIVRTADFPPADKPAEVETQAEDNVEILADTQSATDDTASEATTPAKVKKVTFTEPVSDAKAKAMAQAGQLKLFHEDLAYAESCMMDALNALPSAVRSYNLQKSFSADPKIINQLQATNLAKHYLRKALAYTPDVLTVYKPKTIPAAEQSTPETEDDPNMTYTHRCQAPAGFYTSEKGWLSFVSLQATKGSFYYEPGYDTFLDGDVMIKDGSVFHYAQEDMHKGIACIHSDEYKAQQFADAWASDSDSDSYGSVNKENETASIADSSIKVTVVDGGENKAKGGETKETADDEDALPYTIGDLASAPTAAFFDGYNPGHMPYYQEASCRWTHNIPGNGSHDFLEMETGCFRRFACAREARDRCGDIAEWFKAKLRYRQLMKNSKASVFMKRDYWGNDTAGFIDGREEQMIWRTRRMRNKVFHADGLLQPRSYPPVPSYWYHTR